MYYIAMLSDHYIKTCENVKRRIGFVSGMSSNDVFYDTLKNAVSFDTYETASLMMEYMTDILNTRGNIVTYTLAVCKLQPTIEYHMRTDFPFEIEDEEYNVKVFGRMED